MLVKLGYIDAGNELKGIVSASLSRRSAQLISAKFRSRWRAFDNTASNLTPYLQLQKRTTYRSTIHQAQCEIFVPIYATPVNFTWLQAFPSMNLPRTLRNWNFLAYQCAVVLIFLYRRCQKRSRLVLSLSRNFVVFATTMTT